MIGNSEGVLLQCGWDYVPRDVLQAQMSAQYRVALALLEGNVLPEQFRRERLADPEVLDLATKVRMIAAPEVDALYPERWPSKVTVVMRDGRTHRAEVDEPEGSPARQLGRDEVVAKFLALGAKARPAPVLREIAAMVLDVERLDDLSLLFALLA